MFEESWKTSGKDEIVCPYCYYEFSDSWEYTEDYFETDCPECEKVFRVSRNVSVNFTSEKKEKK